MRKTSEKGSFAKLCLAPASEECVGKTGKDFQNCRKDSIKDCRKEHFSK